MFVNIEIRGHTDSNGNEMENQILSENRAKAVLIILYFQVLRKIDFPIKDLEMLFPYLQIVAKKDGK